MGTKAKKGAGRRRILGSLVALLLVCAPAAIASQGDLAERGCIRDIDTGDAACAGGEVDGLGGAQSVAVSPDGRSVYVASATDSAITTFHRDPATGALSAGGCIGDDELGPDGCAISVDGLGGAGALTVSPDGRSVYVAALVDHAIVRFDREQTTGTLSFASCIDDNDTGQEACAVQADGLAEPTGVAVSPDGRSLYATSFADGAIVRFNRAQSTGALTPAGCIDDLGGGLDTCAISAQGLAGANALVVAPQNNTVYVVSGGDSALVGFVRDQSSGALTPVGCVGDLTSGPPGCLGSVPGLTAARSIAISPEGRSVYAVGNLDSAITFFDRDPTTGALAHHGCTDDDDSGPDACAGSVDGLWGASGAAVSADGSSVYVAAQSDSAVVRLGRDANGFLSPAMCIDDRDSGFDDCLRSADGLEGATGVAVSPDGLQALIASAGADALAVLSLEERGVDQSAPGDTPDADPPETAIERKPKRRTAKRRARFTFTSDEAASFECMLDRRTFKPCSSPFRKRVTAGRHRFEVRATDGGGNVDPTPAEARWRVLPAR